MASVVHIFFLNPPQSSLVIKGGGALPFLKGTTFTVIARLDRAIHGSSALSLLSLSDMIGQSMDLPVKPEDDHKGVKPEDDQAYSFVTNIQYMILSHFF